MQRILFVAILLVSLVLCFVSLGWAGGKEDVRAAADAMLRGHSDEAIRLYTKAIASGDLTQKDLSNAYDGRGAVWSLSKRDYDRAIADYNKAIELDPTNVYGYNGRGSTWYDKGDYGKAIADHTKAIELGPKEYKFGKYKFGSDPGYNLRGRAWLAKGDYDRSIADYTKAIELDPKYSYNYHDRGDTWVKKGDYGRAIADYNKAIKLYPEKSSFYNSLAWILAVCPDAKYRDGAHAVKLAKKAVQLSKNDSGALDTLAAAYAEAGKFQEAIKTQETAIEKLKKEGNTKYTAESEKHLASYKAGKPWREK